MTVSTPPRVGQKVIVHGRHARVERPYPGGFQYRLLSEIDDAYKRGIPVCEVLLRDYDLPLAGEDSLSFALDRIDEQGVAA